MPVILRNGAALYAAKGNGLGVGARKASFFFSACIVAPPDEPIKFAGVWSGGVFAQRGNGSAFNMYAYGLNEAAQSIQLRAHLRCQDTPNTPSVVVELSANVNYYCCLTFDADDQTKQVFWVNAGLNPLSSPASQPLVIDDQPFYVGNASGGSYKRTLTMGPILWLNDYVATESDVWAHIDGVDLAAIAHNAPTATGALWTLDGPIGSPVVAGGAGLANKLSVAFPLTPSIHPAVPGSSAIYSPPIPFTSQVEIGPPVVCSSGESIEFPIFRRGVGSPLKLVPGRSTKMPVVTLATGEKITPDRAVYEANHVAALFLFPDGKKIPKNVAATVDIPAGLFSTALGSSDVANGVEMINCSGRAKYDHKPKTAAVGQQLTRPGHTYWSSEQLTRNLMRRLLLDDTAPDAPALWPDRTLKQDYASWIVDTQNAGGPTSSDLTSTPIPWGHYVIAWSNKDRSKPTTFELLGSVPDSVKELPEYRLDNAPDGECTRVYRVTNPEWAFRLAAPVSATDVEITLEDVSSIQSGVDSRMWMRFGEEYFNVISIVPGTKRVKVGRAVMGTTAAAHPSGEAGIGRWYRATTGLRVAIKGTNGVPLYGPDAVCYGPGDWELPATPGPVRVDRTFAYSRGLSSFINNCISGGWGVVRSMDGACDAFGPGAEPEHMRQDSDLYPGNDSKAVRAFRIVKARPVNPSTVPFTYSHQSGQTYPATLIEPMATAAVGAVEWIKIGHTPDAPVLYGTRIFIGEECVRTLAVDGERVQVVRGSAGTMPASHDPGPIALGWRNPITDEYQYTQADRAYMEVDTDVPHSMLAGQWTSSQLYTDLSLLARFDVPLSAAAPVGSKILRTAIPPSDPRWGLLAVDLWVTFGTENYVVVSADPVAQTVTIKSPLLTAKDATAVGRCSSPGVLCESLDGKTRGWTAKQVGAVVWYPTGPTSAVISFYCYLQGKPGRIVGEQAFDLTPRVVAGVDQSKITTKFPYSLYSIEEYARLAARCPDSFVMVNVPICASEDMVREIARRMLSILPKGRHKLVIEKGNEIWNWLFVGVGPVYQQSKIYKLWDGAQSGSWFDWWIKRSEADAAVVRKAAAVLGREDEILLALPWQAGQTEALLSRARALNVQVDVASWAGYVTPKPSPGNYKAFAGATNAQVWDLWRFDYQYNADNAQNAVGVSDSKAVAKHRAMNPGFPKHVILYECGTDSCLPIPPNGTTDKTVYANGAAKNIDCTYDPNVAHALTDWVMIGQEMFGIDAWCIFNNTQKPGPIARGSGYADANWGFHSHHGQLQGRGDGTDGKHDNRTTLSEPGKPNTKSPTESIHALCVSPRGQWMIDWNREYYATRGPFPEPNPDLDAMAAAFVTRKPSVTTR